jgi:hypothetical protein
MLRALTLTALLPTVALAAEPMDPASVEKYHRASEKITARSFGEAIALFNELAVSYPKVAEIFAGRCSAQVGAKAYATAEADCVYALKVKPDLVSALYALAMAQEGQGKRDAAIDSYRRYAAFDPSAAPYREQALSRLRSLEGGAGTPPPPPLVPADGVGSTGAYGAPKIVVYRNHVGGNPVTNLVLDGKLVGPISLDQYVEIEVAPGEHVLEGRTPLMDSYDAPPLPITLGAETVYVGFGWHGTRMLEVMPAAKAREEIRSDCRKAFSRRVGPDSPQAPPMVSAGAVVIGVGVGGVGAAAPGTRCLMGSDGRNACGYNCRIGSDGVSACADTPDGACSIDAYGHASCSRVGGYGYRVAGVAPGPKPECRMGSDGVNTCGYNCRMGSNGHFYCSSVPNGQCAFNSDGTFSCP